jgi:hypothetical protein
MIMIIKKYFIIILVLIGLVVSVYATDDFVGRACIDLITGRMIEYQSDATVPLGNLTQNAINAGYLPENIEEKYVNQSEFDSLSRYTQIYDAEIDPRDYNFSTLLRNTELQNENINVLYFKAITPIDNSDEWGLTDSFGVSKTVVFLEHNEQSIRTMTHAVQSSIGMYFAWVCCNITKGDRLYSNGGTSTLNGTLTNLYGRNYKTRVYHSNKDEWGNAYVGASTIPDVYNRRGKLHFDGTQVAAALETKNVSVPTLMKIMIINN